MQLSLYQITETPTMAPAEKSSLADAQPTHLIAHDVESLTSPASESPSGLASDSPSELPETRKLRGLKVIYVRFQRSELHTHIVTVVSCCTQHLVQRVALCSGQHHHRRCHSRSCKDLIAVARHEAHTVIGHCQRHGRNRQVAMAFSLVGPGFFCLWKSTDKIPVS